MEQQDLSRRDLEEIIGARTRIAEVLNRKRGLSVAMIRRLHERLGISTAWNLRGGLDSAESNEGGLTEGGRGSGCAPLG